MSKMVQINCLFPAELLARLRAESARTGAPLNELVRRAVAAALPAPAGE
jgi:hypothetical protein